MKKILYLTPSLPVGERGPGEGKEKPAQIWAGFFIT
jgi:hypothetical protein